MGANIFNSPIVGGRHVGATIMEDSKSVCSQEMTAIEPGRQFCISLKNNAIDLSDNPYGYSFTVRFFRADKTSLNASATCTAVKQNGVIMAEEPFTMSAAAAYVHIDFGARSSPSIVSPEDVGDFMVNYGSEPLPYEPYGGWKMRIDRMGIRRMDDTTDDERYRSLYLIHRRANNVNDYGGNVADREKLANITDAAPGSTCLYHSGEVDRLELDGWSEYGG